MRGNEARLCALITTTAAFACVCFCPAQVMAQEDARALEAPDTLASDQQAQTYVGGPSPERRRELYEEAKLDHRTALLYSAALPGLGNIYADKIFRGATWMGIFGMSIFSGLAGWRTSDNRLVILGISGGVVSYAGGFLTSYRDVTTYNERLQRRYKVHEANQDAQGGRQAPIGIGYTWRF